MDAEGAKKITYAISPVTTAITKVFLISKKYKDATIKMLDISRAGVHHDREPKGRLQAGVLSSLEWIQTSVLRKDEI
jgi:hypothetical protein